jgi:hypothetical protein
MLVCLNITLKDTTPQFPAVSVNCAISKDIKGAFGA